MPMDSSRDEQDPSGLDSPLTPVDKFAKAMADVLGESKVKTAGNLSEQSLISNQEKYHVELIGTWAMDLPVELREKIEDIISWRIPHQPEWYPLPGRTLVVKVGDYAIKVKGAGFYNPGNVSYAGTKRTTSPVPEGPEPVPPLEELFKRDLVHSDPSESPPHILESIHSTFAPIGGMTLNAAVHDQTMFASLQAAHLPSNRPLAAYENKDLSLDGQAMGVSVSLLPDEALQATAFQLYLSWKTADLGPSELQFFKKYSGRGEEFSYENPSHRLELLAKLARTSGKLLFEFSAKAGLYRFSGGPDNWNLKNDLDEPLYFSDVDTSRKFDTIPPEQRGWEVLRNLNSAIHNWLYYFLPILSHKESGYTPELLQQKEHDFMREMLRGFFHDKSESDVEKVSAKIWKFFDLPISEAAKEETPLGLRTGEYFLQKFYTRPVFHLTMLSLLSELIQDSEFQKAFPFTDMSVEGIKDYVSKSAEHESHAKMFPNYSPEETKVFITEMLAKV